MPAIKKSPRILALGIMCGSSWDSWDLALVEVDTHGFFKIKGFESRSFSEKNRIKLQYLWEKSVPRQYIFDLDENLTQELVRKIQKSPLFTHKVQVIGVHGPTLVHKPGSYSIQLGNPFQLAAKLKKPIVSHFRSWDTAQGFAGAPLAGLFHQQMVRQFSLRGCVSFHNIGGIHNLTRIQEGKITHSFDGGPGNLPLNIITQNFLNPPRPFDPNGKIAQKGRVIPKLIKDLQIFWEKRLQQKGWQPLSRDEIHGEWVYSWIKPWIPKHPVEDILRTFTEFVAWTMALPYKKLPVQTVYLCGGGAFNHFLLERFQAYLGPSIRVTTTQEIEVHPKWIESAAFGWLSARRLQNHRFHCKNLTGNPHPTWIGQVFTI